METRKRMMKPAVLVVALAALPFAGYAGLPSIYTIICREVYGGGRAAKFGGLVWYDF